MRIGILLYGFSTYAIRTLCGFRDYIIARLLDNIASKYSKFPPYLSKYISARFSGKSCFETDMSDLFDIYVMEGQPKNIQSWRGTIYHDGYTYCEKIKKRGFCNVTLVADAIAGTLLSQYFSINVEQLRLFNKNCMGGEETIHYPPIVEKSENNNEEKYCLFPRINYLILGANGFSEKYVYHSAGHLAAICDANERGRTEIILATQTSKFLNESRIPGNNLKTSSRCIPLPNHSFTDKDGWSIMHSCSKENVRSSVFIPYDDGYFTKKTSLYTPSEEKIRFFEIDYVITEKQHYSTLDLASEDIPQEKKPPKSVYSRGPKMLVDRRVLEPQTDYSQNSELLKGFERAGEKLAKSSNTNDIEDVES